MEPSQPSPYTLAYLASLSTALSPFPALSARASSSLSALTSSAGLAPPTQLLRRETKCAHCGTQLIGGFNATFALECSAKLVASCAGCGEVTRRALAREEGELSNRGRHRFARVRKKQVKLRIEAGRAKLSQAQLAPPSALPRAAVVKPSAPAAPSQPSTQPSKHQSNIQQSARTPTPAASPAPILANKTVPYKAAATTLDSAAAGKKRKRSNKPAGLAEMLEAKKKAAAAGSGKLGLQDFLGGM